MHDVGARGVAGDQQVDAHRRKRGVGAVELGRRRICGRSRLVADGPEAPHAHVDVASQRSHELGRVHARTPVDLRRILAGEQVDAHTATLAQGHPTWTVFEGWNRVGRG